MPLIRTTCLAQLIFPKFFIWSILESLSARVSRNLPALQTVQIRLKGHSKWQNIRHIKAANDLRIGRLCNKYTHLIGTAIREHGMEKNPEYNCKSNASLTLDIRFCRTIWVEKVSTVQSFII